MARKKSPTPTEAELRFMDILWKRGPATVSDVVDALPKKQPLAYSTVLTTLRILEEKGYLRHTKEGRAFVYHPVVDKRQAGRSAVRWLLSRFFGGSRERLLVHLLAEEKVDAAEMKRLRKRIAEPE